MEVKGLITAMVTPFDAKGKINVEATKQLVNKLIGKKIDGLFILGTNGEFHVLTIKEKLEFAEIVINETAGRVPVYVGTGGNSTDHVIELSKEMSLLGADALSVITPYFVTPTEEELKRHYWMIADAVSVPIMLYNIPKNTGINISLSTVDYLADHENIIGIKDSSGDLTNMKEYIEKTKDKAFNVLSGSDSLILEGLKIGAKGAVAATSNVLTTIDGSIINYFNEGNIEAAQVSQASIEEFRRVLKFGTIPSVLKEAICLEGINVGQARLPVSQLSIEHKKEIKTVIENYRNLFSDL
ncbi:4-hydroxy-tetrahydrodipicolinate synthase [Enterococcus sp. LJL99]